MKIRQRIERKRTDKNPFWRVVILSKDMLARNFWKDRAIRGIFMPKYNALYIVVPKVANTSISKVLMKMDPSAFIIHKKDFEKYKKKSLVFTFVRDPYDRIVSCYKDKIRDPRYTENNPVFKKGVWKNFPVKIRKTKNFKEFARIITNIPDRRAEEHFKSQYYFLTGQKGQFLPDFVGRFENLKTDYKKICKILGIKKIAQLPHENKSSRERDFWKYYDEDTKRIIRKRYEKDFELIGKVNGIKKT